MSDLKLEIDERGGEVFLRLGAEDCYIPPDMAIQVAKTILDCAGAAEHGGETLAKNATIETSRKILIPRVVHIIRNLQDKKKSPEFIATEVVDRVLIEIL